MTVTTSPTPRGMPWAEMLADMDDNDLDIAASMISGATLEGKIQETGGSGGGDK
jgi:hypothetical protein